MWDIEVVLIRSCTSKITQPILILLSAFSNVKACVESGEERIAIASQTDPDLILVYLYLPGMNGLEITRRLRGIDSLNGSKIMLLTADI